MFYSLSQVGSWIFTYREKISKKSLINFCICFKKLTLEYESCTLYELCKLYELKYDELSIFALTLFDKVKIK